MSKVIPGFGDNVRIRATPLTEKLGYTGLTGSVAGETTPSLTGVEVIGEATQDFALNVMFDDQDRPQMWFAPDLVEFIDHAAGTEMRVGNVRMVRRADGEWDRVATPNSPGRHTAAAFTAGVLSVLLLLAAFYVVGQLIRQLNRIPRLPAEALFFAKLGMFDAALVMAASGSSLAYLATSHRKIWNTARILLLLSIGTTCLLALLYWMSLDIHQPNRQRNDFSGIADLAAFVIGVFIPAVVALTTLVVLLCLNYLRPQRNTPARTDPVRP